MMEVRLQRQLGDLERAFRRARCLRQLAGCWAAAAGAGILLVLIQGFAGWNSRLTWLLPLAGGIVASFLVWRRAGRRLPDFRGLIADVERSHPELRYLMSAAAEQEPDPESGDFRFLQLRVIEEVVLHPERRAWRRRLEGKLASARTANRAAFAGFLAVMGLLAYGAFEGRPALGTWSLTEVTVNPGDTRIERGTGLVVSARFGRQPPPEATLVLTSASGKTSRIALARPLADPVFGASLPEITEDQSYHIEFGSRKTRDYRIRVFDYPALVRADADLRFPPYTGLTNRTIRDTRRVSAVEGTRLTYTLQLNKPVAQARFLAGQPLTPAAPGKSGSADSAPAPAGTNENRSPRIVPPPALTIQSNAVVLLQDFVLTNTARYSLELVDADGRTNKFPADFFLQALPNRRPELKLAFPRGDPRVSPLEEVQLQAEAADDFGLLKCGLGFGVAGGDPQLVELGQAAPANERRRFSHLLPLEKLGVETDQVVAYFVWADDFGPDGRARRTFSDIYFAEIRPFEEIFRRDQSGAAESGAPNESGNQGTRLAELQKQIIIATWKLQREKGGVATPDAHENTF